MTYAVNDFFHTHHWLAAISSNSSSPCTTGNKGEAERLIHPGHVEGTWSSCIVDLLIHTSSNKPASQRPNLQGFEIVHARWHVDILTCSGEHSATELALILLWRSFAASIFLSLVQPTHGGARVGVWVFEPH